MSSFLRENEGELERKRVQELMSGWLNAYDFAALLNPYLLARSAASRSTSRWRLLLARLGKPERPPVHHLDLGDLPSKLPPESLVHGLGVWLRAIAGRTDGQAVSFDATGSRART